MPPRSRKQWLEFLRRMHHVRLGWRVHGDSVSVHVTDLELLISEVGRSRKEAAALRARARRSKKAPSPR